MIYCFICPTCGTAKEITRSVRQRNDPIDCPDCGTAMLRDLQAERTSTSGDYNKPVVSSSMAFPADEIPEHRRRFPDVDIKSDGFTAQPVLRSLRQKRAYAKKRGFVDTNAYF